MEEKLERRVEKLRTEDLYLPQQALWEAKLDEYSKRTGLKFKKDSYALASYKHEQTPENTRIVLVRIALADLETTTSKERKYVALQTFYDYGEYTSIDIVSLPLVYHRDIVREYLENVLTQELRRNVPLVDENLSSMFLIAGGFVKLDGDTLKLSGSSSDFSNQFSIYDVNDIAAYLTKQSGLFKNVESENMDQGKEYINRCLEIMLKYLHKPEFYSQLIDLYHLEPVRHDQYVMPHLLGALVMMKAMDDAFAGRGDFIKNLVKETSEGLGREIFLRGVAEKS